MTSFNAIPIGVSVSELETLYGSFYTQRLADECRIMSSKLRELKSPAAFLSSDEALLKRELTRRLRVAKRLLSKRQLALF